MNVALNIQLGLWGFQRRLNPIWLDVPSIGATSSWAGSYHVLSMGRHYDDYMLTGQLATLPAIPGFPLAHPYERLAGKIRAAGVTGNIGEAVAALFARRYLNAEIRDIAHVRPRQPFKRRKSPDYLMRLGSLLPGVFSAVLSGITSLNWPTWVPVESKARGTVAGARAGRRVALEQLIAYWSLIVNSAPSEVGYGMAVTFTYQLPREIRVSLFVPKNAAQLIANLQATGEQTDEALIRASLHGC